MYTPYITCIYIYIYVSTLLLSTKCILQCRSHVYCIDIYFTISKHINIEIRYILYTYDVMYAYEKS